MFTDSHCHIYTEYYDNLEDIINLSIDSNVVRLLNNGCDIESNKLVLETINNFEQVYGAIGIHPEYVNNYSLEDIKFIENNLSNKKIIAIGEIGLDYHYTKDDKDKQIELFEIQLKLAEKYDIPVIIHSRDATMDTINTLKKYNVKGVIHSFSGSLETAKEYMKMGFYLGVNGVVTFKNSNIKNVIKEISIDKLLLETDSPYLTPEPFRGKKNNPSHIIDIAKFICELKNITMEELSYITNNNFDTLFNINTKNDE